jgi:O-antigen/teichoic acid export membrane protein
MIVVSAGVILALACLGGALIFASGETRSTLFVVAVALPGLLFQDFSRFVFFAQGLPKQSLLSDLLWATGEAVAIVLLLVNDGRATWLLLGAWTLGVYFGAIFSYLKLRPSPSLEAAIEWIRTTRGMTIWMAGQAILSQASVHITVVAVGVVVGLSSLGGLRAAQTLLGPLTTALAVAPGYLLPTLGLLAQSDLGAFRRLLGLITLVTTGAAVLYGFGIVLWRADLLPRVFGDGFEQFSTLTIPISCAAVAQGIAVAPGLGNRALRSGKAVFLTQFIASVAGIPLILALSARYGALGAAIGILGQMTLLACSSWILFFHTFSLRRTT